jgi:hypothetical protein
MNGANALPPDPAILGVADDQLAGVTRRAGRSGRVRGSNGGAENPSSSKKKKD